MQVAHGVWCTTTELAIGNGTTQHRVIKEMTSSQNDLLLFKMYGVKPGTQLAITSITMLTNLINEWTRNVALEPTAVDTSPLRSLVTTGIISGGAIAALLQKATKAAATAASLQNARLQQQQRQQQQQ